MEAADQARAFGGLSRLHLIMGVQCNVRCTMCYQTDFSPKFNMPPELYKEKLKEAYAHVTSVKLQGGEPTIMKNCKEAAILLREHPKAKLTVITNGVLIDDFWHETIVNQGGHLAVSINAATNKAYEKIVIAGEYGRVIKNLERVLAARKGKTPSVVVSAVMLKENFSETAALIELAGKMGIDGVEFMVDPIVTFAGLPGRSEILAEMERCVTAKAKYPDLAVTGLDDFGDKFAFPIRFAGPKAAKKAMCGAPFHNVVVDWDGTVRICCNTWVKVGNLYEKPLEQILQDRMVQRFQAKMKADDYVWCSPNCPDNASPTKLSLAHKYIYEARQDPKQFMRKVEQKFKQVRGKWVTIRKKRSKPLEDRKGASVAPGPTGKVRLPVLGDDGSRRDD